MTEITTQPRMMIIMCVSVLAFLGQDVSGQLALQQSPATLPVPLTANQKSDFALYGVGEIEEDESILPQAGLLEFMLSKPRFLGPAPRDSDSVALICPRSISNECPGGAEVTGLWNGLQAALA